MERHHWKALTIAWNLSHLLLLAPERWPQGSSSESLGRAPSPSSCFSVVSLAHGVQFSLRPRSAGSTAGPSLLPSFRTLWPST